MRELTKEQIEHVAGAGYLVAWDPPSSYGHDPHKHDPHKHDHKHDPHKHKHHKHHKPAHRPY